LIDSETTQDFVSLLPVTLSMNDLFCREKFGHLPRAISEGKSGREVMKSVTWSIGRPGQMWQCSIAMMGRRFPRPASSSLRLRSPVFYRVRPFRGFPKVRRGSADLVATVRRDHLRTEFALSAAREA
jgi:hypothetical protein